MKMVIDIPESVYESISSGKFDIDGYFKRNLSDAFKNGTPLPKGHGTLKDADIYKAEVYKYIEENKNSDDLYLAGCGDGAYHAMCMLKDIPTIIEADGGGEE